jgi:CBS domain-containing protein
MFLEKTYSVEITTNEILFTEDEMYHKGVYFILSGQVSLRLDDVEYKLLQPGEIVGLTTFVGKSTYSFSARAEADSELLYVPEICIYKLMADFGHFRKQFYQITLGRLNLTNEEELLSLASHTYKAVGSHMTSPVITKSCETPIIEASALMANRKIGALILTDSNEEICGLITTKHIVHNYIPTITSDSMDIPSSEIMDKNPTIIPKEYPLIEALAEMQSKNKDYAVVANENKPIGIISNKDIMRTIYETTTTMNYHVANTSDLEELKQAKADLYKVAKDLINNSRLTSEILKTISSLHLSIQKQVYQITLAEYKKKTSFDINTVDFCMTIMGSGARKEMMLNPDQDSGYIFGNNLTNEEKDHLMEFGADFSKNVDYVGYEFCKGNIMTTNPELSKTLDEWKENVYGMINNPGKQGLTWSSIVFDLEGFMGNDALVWELKSFILESVVKNNVFLLQLFEKEASATVPLSIFGKFITIKDGENKGMLDLKGSALSFIVFIARLNTLKSGLNDTNTIDRLKHLGRIGAFSSDTIDNILYAYEIITDLAFREQIRKAENNEPMNKLIDPAKLSLYNQQKLKEALNDISKFVTLARKKFKGQI